MCALGDEAIDSSQWHTPYLEPMKPYHQKSCCSHMIQGETPRVQIAFIANPTILPLGCLSSWLYLQLANTHSWQSDVDKAPEMIKIFLAVRLKSSSQSENKADLMCTPSCKCLQQLIPNSNFSPSPRYAQHGMALILREQ